MRHTGLPFTPLLFRPVVCNQPIYLIDVSELSICPSTFSFPDSNSKMLCPVEFKLSREIDHHHSYVAFEIGVIPSVCLSSCCLFVCLSTFLFPDSNSNTLCPIEFKLDREIDHHHSQVAFEIGTIPFVCLSVYSIVTIM